MELLLSNDKEIYDITELVNDITYTDKLNDGCSKLEFKFAGNDPKVGNANKVRFNHEDIKFDGYVFKHGHNKKKETTVTSYDQLRYAKAKDIVVSQKDTVSSLARRMNNYLGLRQGYIADVKYILPTKVHENNTWLDVMYDAISDTLTNTGKWYCLRDEYGEVAIRDIEDLQLDLVLGDESLAYDYDYSKSIDDNFYNRIKIYVEDKEKAVGSVIVKEDKESIKKYGMLQYFEILDKNGNPAQAKFKAEMLLGLYNREAETLTLECLGDPRIRAGSSFYGQIADIELEKRLIVRKATHKFLPIHTMTLEVAI